MILLLPKTLVYLVLMPKLSLCTPSDSFCPQLLGCLLNRRGVVIESSTDPLRSKFLNLGNLSFRVAPPPPPELLSSEVFPSAFLEILPRFDFCCFLPTSGERPKVDMRSPMSLSSSSKLYEKRRIN